MYEKKKAKAGLWVCLIIILIKSTQPHCRSILWNGRIYWHCVVSMFCMSYYISFTVVTFHCRDMLCNVNNSWMGVCNICFFLIPFLTVSLEFDYKSDALLWYTKQQDLIICDAIKKVTKTFCVSLFYSYLSTIFYVKFGNIFNLNHQPLRHQLENLFKIHKKVSFFVSFIMLTLIIKSMILT